ncbi:MAG: hypothetical protein D6710_04610 [Nitrospirae bacterium]|nr:MAG: hypothetical protein D6710_04610 [Nitrospirota bacterium]
MMIKRIGTLIVAALLIALYVNYIRPIPEKRQEIREETFLKKKKLKKYRELTMQKEEIERELANIKARIEKMNDAFLPVKNETLGLVTIQQIVREGAQKANLRLVSLRPVDLMRGKYIVGLPVQVTAVGDIKAFTEFLKTIVESPYLLSLDMLNIRVINIQKPDNIRIKFTLTGYIPKPEKTVKKEKAKRNV